MKAQMHFEIDHELRAHWKAFFTHMPRGSETRTLTELMRNFLENAKTQYKEKIAPAGSGPTPSLREMGYEPDEDITFKEAQDDPGTPGMDQQSNRAGVHDEPGVEGFRNGGKVGEGTNDPNPKGSGTQA